MEKFYESQEEGVSSSPALNESSWRILMKPFAGLGSQMALIDQPLNQSGNPSVTANLGG